MNGLLKTWPPDKYCILNHLFGKRWRSHNNVHDRRFNMWEVRMCMQVRQEEKISQFSILGKSVTVSRRIKAVGAARRKFFLYSQKKAFILRCSQEALVNPQAGVSYLLGGLLEKVPWPQALPWKSHLHYLALKWLSFTHTCTAHTFHSSPLFHFLSLLCVTGLTERQWTSDVCNCRWDLRPGCTCDVQDETITHMTR